MTLVNNSISVTAEYGALTRGKLVINEGSKKGMKEIFERIQDASFATEWLLENQAGAPRFKTVRKHNDEHPLEEVGKRIRAMMPWLDARE